jgi:hypothetical protein
MDDFAYLLVRASKALGNTLGVAQLLEVEPLQVYRWIAGMDPPSDARRAELTARLQQVFG